MTWRPRYSWRTLVCAVLFLGGLTGLVILRGDPWITVRKLEGHTDEILGCAYSPDGLSIVTHSLDGTCRVWDVGNGRCRAVLKGHSGCVYDATFSPNGRLIASAAQDKSVRIWDAASGECIRALEGHPEEVSRTAFSPDGQVVAASSGQDVWLWRYEQNGEPKILKGLSVRFLAMAFSADGELFAAGGSNSAVSVWRTTTGELVGLITGPYVTRLEFSPDGTTLKIFAREGLVEHRNIETGQLVHREWLDRPQGRFCILSEDAQERVTFKVEPFCYGFVSSVARIQRRRRLRPELWTPPPLLALLLWSLWRDRKRFKLLDAKQKQAEPAE
jgi:WD40 repeat protein